MDVVAVAEGRAGVPEFYNFAVDCVGRWATQRPGAPAMHWINESGSTQLRLTFSQINERACRAAAVFRAAGIKAGDRVLVITHRIPQWWEAVLGLMRIGAVPIPGTPLLTPKDISYRLQVAEAAGIIADEAAVEKVSDFSGPRFAIGMQREGWVDYCAAADAALPDMAAQPTRSSDAAIIYFTSGTTGDAKMVVHTHASYGIAHAITGAHWLDLGHDDIIWALADTGWGKTAWSNYFGPWLMGACVFVMDMRGKFDPALILKTLCNQPISVFCAPATAFRLLVRRDLHACKFKALRHCVSAGESLNAPLYAQWLSGTGLHIYEGYGQTETVLCIANVRSHNRPIRPGSMGHATPGFTIGIVDDAGHALPPGSEGNLAVRVRPQRPVGLFREYWKNAAETASRFVGDWYLTGDRGVCDEEGYFWFVGRSDDVINSSSYRIGPSEVESALLEHPAVLESAAIGAPDPMRGEVVKSFIVLREGYEPSDTLKKELQAHCKRVTAPYKYPRQIEFVTELPKTISGKIRRGELKRRELLKPRPAPHADAGA
jgi:acetyl-CoA synthetase/medium-chain acyl-CoA synthetase